MRMSTIALDRPALNASRTGGMTGEERLVVFAFLARHRFRMV